MLRCSNVTHTTIFIASRFFLQMALSAGTPILRGYLSDLDCRWCVIAGAVDDRTPEERGLEVRRKCMLSEL